MFSGSAASWTALKKSLFKGNAACITPAVIPSPPQPHARFPGTLAGGGSGPRDRDPPRRGAGLPAELLRPPSRCLLRWSPRCHTSDVKCRGGWIRHRAVRWRYHSGFGRSDKSPAPVNVKGPRFTVTFTHAVSVMGRFDCPVAQTSPVPPARSRGRARGSGEGSRRCVGVAEGAA